MKKKKAKKVSSLMLKNTIFVLGTVALVFLLIIVFLILIIDAGVLFKGGPQPVRLYGHIFMLMIALFTIFIYFIYKRNQKITDTIKKLEEATAEVAKGNFKVSVEMTDDESLNSYIKNFNQMAKELDRIETIQADFISNVSHEFKTPLSVIQSYSKILRRKDLDTKTRKQYEEVLDNNIKKLTNLTSNILSLAKLENQEIILDKTEFLLDEQIRQCVVERQLDWSKKEIDINLTLPKITYYGSEELIGQVWQNLINNAIKYTDKKGKINITALQEGEEIIVSIQDNGIGMSNEVVEKIFDKFYQGDPSHTGDGNGLGLALVSRILKICDGNISVSSQEGKGSTFIVKLKNENKKD